MTTTIRDLFRGAYPIGAADATTDPATARFLAICAGRAVDGAGGTFTATYDAGQSAPHGDLSVEPHASQSGLRGVISRFSGASLCSPFSGDRGVHYAESTIGTFRTRVAGRRVVLALNDVAISTCRDPARAKAQAERLAKAAAAHMARREPAQGTLL